ncbi:hypothetical protein CC85DRAFT_299561 [Cutaneotrichosporon oleaginosum]|uniref:BHLH domain-containing protein n=1 Tax=Cutaneotrichosporon oleaginosum TaxID=879819 RepID=A0A0J1BBW7_9TREE|nr:uncharacterized protein CC85DRAFT_299561 [Cutaneotrichosporon oleaginosum]KLT45499.1 hypothetical protein CC85DRAFT_299561 [Cutaneotrichosporon oleaginosum]TXT14546.1 hypothetical protein COLE_00739 [Cutaneotrichosporon oleaginosum]
METNAAALSPTSSSQAYLSSLDFFALAGLDGTSLDHHHHHSHHDSPHAHTSAPHSHHHQGSQSHEYDSRAPSQKASPEYVPLDDPSPIALEAAPSRPSSRQGYRLATQSRDSAMDVDHSPNVHGSGSGEQQTTHSHHHHQQQQHQHQHHSRSHSHADGREAPLDAHDFMNMDMSSAAYDAVQAGILQHQLESIHMQSPFVAATNPTSPYNAMAQMFLTSPPAQSSAQDSGSSQGQLPDERRPIHPRTYSVSNGPYGVLTPGPSGDIPAEMRMDLMSPMQLGVMIEGKENFNAVPLLSPALSHHNPSNYASPVAQVAFGAGGRDAAHNAHINRAALEQLQLQQRQFQEQLALLQEQQRQLQATAAAVAAASGSPYLAPQQSHQHPHSQAPSHSQSQGRSGLTPGGVNGNHSTGTVSTPSPGSYFSPLTSPALEPAVSRSAALRAAAQHLSPHLHSQQHRAPHPLSALSSPALNPVGSSGGANQTLSPALGPQNPDMNDPDYLDALQGILDGSAGSSADVSANVSTNASGGYHSSPVIVPSNTNSSPAVGSSGAGPHRSMPAKSRPSPMMKPTNHRSHVRGASTSVPTSPMAFKMSSGSGGSGFLPPAAIDNRGVQPQMLGGASSQASTPSPVDLAQIMPPPPVPSQGRPKIPMTPASLMNLSKEAAESPEEPVASTSSTSAPPPPRAAAKKATSALAPQPPRRGSRLVPASGTAAAKRSLAIRPPGVGVRAATKGAAAAAGAIEPETRRTSHKAAEQKRRDSLKAGFDELRLLLPPINTEALDPESGEPIPGSSAPRLLPKSSLVPDDNPNRGVSKVALLKFSNEYIVRLHDKVNKRDEYIDKLRAEVTRLRLGETEEVRGDEDEDLLEMDMLDGEEDDLGDEDEEMDIDTKKKSVQKSPALGPTGRRRSTARKKDD